MVNTKRMPISYVYPPIFVTITDHMWTIITQMTKVDWLAAVVLLATSSVGLFPANRKRGPAAMTDKVDNVFQWNGIRIKRANFIFPQI